nr:Cytidine and deoxycytidylate deaminase zinc-binding region [uncultured bacterium]
MPKKQAIIAYVPAIHSGYKKLFDSYPDAVIMVLGDSLIFDIKRKDLRALTPKDAVRAIEGLGRKAAIIQKDAFKDLVKTYSELIFPNEDISRDVYEKYLEHFLSDYDFHSNFIDIFLRWDRRQMEAVQDKHDPNGRISTDDADKKYMLMAAKIAGKSSNIWRRVGAVIVKGGKVVAESSNVHQPSPHANWIDGDPRNNANRGSKIDVSTDMHAEALLIAQAAKDGLSLHGAKLYVTTFPCPTCAKLIAKAGFKQCYYSAGYSMLDGREVLESHGVELIRVLLKNVESDANGAIWVPYPEKKSTS